MLSCEFLVIGSGETGLRLAKELAFLDRDVVLVEQDSFGGSYLHSLEIPKFWLKSESTRFQNCLEIFKDYERTHQSLIDYRQSLQRIIEDKVASTIDLFLKDYQQTPNLKIIPGKASFFSKNLIEIQNGSSRDFLTFEHVIIATGKNNLIRPAFLKDKGLTFLHQYDIYQFKKIPSKLLIIGFTPFNLEVADIYSSLGTKIDIVDSRSLHDILPSLDETGTNYLNKFLSSKNIDFFFDNKSIRLTQNDDLIIAKFDNSELEYDAMYVFVEESYSETGLGLHRVGIGYDKTGIITDFRGRTSLNNVWAFGCCSSRTNQFNKRSSITDFIFKVRRLNPQIRLWDAQGFIRDGQSVIGQASFSTNLQLSKPIYSIGLSEERAESMYSPDIEVELVQKIDKEGFIKIIFKPSSGLVVGATFLGAMSEYRHYVNVAMNTGINAIEVIRYILDD